MVTSKPDDSVLYIVYISFSLWLIQSRDMTIYLIPKIKKKTIKMDEFVVN